MKSEKLLYVTPRTIRYGVLTEGTFASSLENDATLDPDVVKVEVEQYAEIGNDVTFN